MFVCDFSCYGKFLYIFDQKHDGMKWHGLKKPRGLECGFPSYRWSVSRCNSCKSGSKEICIDSKLLFFFWHDEDRILEKLYNKHFNSIFPFPFFGLKGFPKTGVKRPSALHPTLTPFQSAASPTRMRKTKCSGGRRSLGGLGWRRWELDVGPQQPTTLSWQITFPEYVLEWIWFLLIIWFAWGALFNFQFGVWVGNVPFFHRELDLFAEQRFCFWKNILIRLPGMNI